MVMNQTKLIKLGLSLNIKLIILLSFTIIILLWSFFQPPRRYGDGLEYLAMTVSIGNHFSPNLTEQDKVESQVIARLNNDKLNPDFPGYFKDLNGQYYSFHFWAYSMLCVPIYWFLKLLNANPLSVFQIMNAILLSVALYWTLFVSRIEDKLKIWFISGIIFNPIILYVHYTHPELYSFVLLYIALLCWMDERRVLACLFAVLASWQNPAIAIVPAYFGLVHLFILIKNKKITKEFMFVTISCFLVVVPYLWTYWHYHKFSLIGDKSTTGISIEKALNLMFDLNMGLFLYLPLHFVILVWLIFKRDKTAITFSLLLIIIALINSTQLNWNSGMSYINRYASWMIPLVLVGCYPFFKRINGKWFISSLVITSLFTGVIVTFCIVTYKQFNYITFSSFARLVMAKAPGLYNPPAEIFIERSKNIEITPDEAKNYLPLAATTDKGIKKVLVHENGKYRYYNEDIDLRAPSKTFTLSMPQESIFKSIVLDHYDGGWRGLEKSNDYFRWSTIRSNLYFSTGSVEGKKNITMVIASFERNRACEIKFNNAVVFRGDIPPDFNKLSFTADILAMNVITITSVDDDISKDTPQSLRFNVRNIEIT